MLWLVKVKYSELNGQRQVVANKRRSTKIRGQLPVSSLIPAQQNCQNRLPGGIIFSHQICFLLVIGNTRKGHIKRVTRKRRIRPTRLQVNTEYPYYRIIIIVDS